MRKTYTDLKKAHFRFIGKADQYADTVLSEDFNYSLGARYQTIFGTISSFINQDELTSSTVANQQYYSYPVGTVSVDSATISIGNMKYTLQPIYSQQQWNYWNALQIQPTAIPQFIFPRKDDFGIWPIPTDVYTITFQRFFRDRNLAVEDYITGTIDVTNDDTTITGTNNQFTDAMVGRWLTVTDISIPGQGYWYQIASVTDSSHLKLSVPWAAISSNDVAFRIGESPEIPEEAHSILPYGTAADYYSGLKNDADNATRFDNFFWSGSFNTSSRDLADKNITAGLIGLYKKYMDRERDNIIQRQPQQLSPSYKIFAQEIT